MKDIYSAQIDQFQDSLNLVMKDFNKRVISLLMQYKTERGYLTFNARDLNFATQSLEGLVKLLKQAGYDEAVKKLLGKEAALLNEYKSLRPAGAVPIALTARMTSQLKALQQAELVIFDNISSQSMMEIQKQLINGVLTGAKMDVIVEAIQSTLESNMHRYAWTYANTSRARYLQAVEDIAAGKDRYEEDVYWEYVGPDDDLTRPACVQGLEIGVFTDAERLSFEADTADERAYNCRHTFMRINKETYEELK